MVTQGLRRRQRRLPAPQVPKASPVRKDRMRKERAPGVDRARLALLQALQARLPVPYFFYWSTDAYNDSHRRRAQAPVAA